MNILIDNHRIPGTVLDIEQVNGLTGMDFLKQVFFVSSGIMLTQIRNICGIDGSTLQNWTKRGWVNTSRLKKYNMDQVARILIINMLRPCMQLEKITALIEYINGDLIDTSDDIISDSMLYDYVCRIINGLGQVDVVSDLSVQSVIDQVISDYREPTPGAKDKLHTALTIMINAYCAASIKLQMDRMLSDIGID